MRRCLLVSMVIVWGTAAAFAADDAELRKLRAENKELREQIRDLQKEVRDVRDGNAKLATEVEYQEKRIQRADREISKLRKAMGGVKDADAQRVIQQLQAQNKALREEVTRLDRQTADLKQRYEEDIGRLHKQIVSLQEQIRRFQELLTSDPHPDNQPDKTRPKTTTRPATRTTNTRIDAQAASRP